MKKLIRPVIVFITYLLTGTQILLGQSWTSIDGGGSASNINSSGYYGQNQATAVYNGELYVIWSQTSSGNTQIHIKKYNGSTWTGVGTTAGQTQLNSSTTGATNPKLAVCNGYLYAAWVESDVSAGHSCIHVKRYDGTSWLFVQDYTSGENRKDINQAITGDAFNVDLAVFNNELYASWVENANGTTIPQLRISKFNGSLWTSIDGNGTYGLNYNTGYNAYAPCLCVYNNNLYVSWTENNSSSIAQLRIKRYDGGSTWTFVDGGAATGINYLPANTAASEQTMVTYNNSLYLFWVEGVDVSTTATPNYKQRIRGKQYDGSGWTATLSGTTWYNSSSTRGTSIYPSCLTYNNLLYIAWQEAPALTGTLIANQIRVASFNGSATSYTYIDGNATTGINQDKTMDALFPKLTEMNGDLYAIWNENNSTTLTAPQVRAKKYPLPAIPTSVAVPAAGTYIMGQNLNFTVTFNKAVDVTGTPYIPITLNTGGTVNATYVSGSGTTALLFRYTVVAGNADSDGITIGSSINLSSGTIKNKVETYYDAGLTLNNIASTTAVLVDGIAPTVTSIIRQSPTVTTTSATSLTYRVTFSKNVNGVDKADFTLTKVTGSATGTVATVSAVSGNTFDVTVNSITGTGTLRLDLNSSSTGITDTPGNPISVGYTSGETYTIATPGTWTGATSTDWATATNWAGGTVPTSSTDVIIPSGLSTYPIISAATSADCNNLTVNGSLTIASLSSSTGSLIVHGTSTGNVTVQSNLTGGKWHTVSAPVSSQSISSFLGVNGSLIDKNTSYSDYYRMMAYNEGGNCWYNGTSGNSVTSDYFRATTSGNLETGIGYGIHPTSNAVINYTGAINSTSFTVNVTNGLYGWNCIGNPYTSAIGITSAASSSKNFLSENGTVLNDSYACLYVWNEDGAYDGSQSYYKVISNSGFITSKTKLTQDYVAPGQGFFIRTKTAGPVISFSKDMQYHQTGQAVKATRVSWPGIELQVKNDSISNATIIAFNNAMTKGLDPTYDAGLLRKSSDLNIFSRLVKDNSVDFAIQCLPEKYDSLVVALGVECKAGGKLTFSAETAELPADCKVILEDKTTGTFTSLANGATYSVTVNANTTGTGRFFLHTSSTTTGSSNGTTAVSDLTSGENLKVYAIRKVVYITGSTLSGSTVKVYDLNGRNYGMVKLTSDNTATLDESALPAGLYMVHITNTDGKVKTFKVILE